eukprot:3096620-Pyramimonas_sp.AAC.1
MLCNSSPQVERETATLNARRDAGGKFEHARNNSRNGSADMTPTIGPRDAAQLGQDARPDAARRLALARIKGSPRAASFQ